MAETVKELEIAGTVYPIEDATARQGVLTPVVNTDNEITALTPVDETSLALADTKVRQSVETIEESLSQNLLKVKEVTQPLGALSGNADSIIDIIPSMSAGQKIKGIVSIGTQPLTTWDTQAIPWNINITSMRGIIRTLGDTAQGYNWKYLVFYTES